MSENLSQNIKEDNVSTHHVLKAKHRDLENSTTWMRNEGWVPGVVFGKDFNGLNIMVPKTELKKFFHSSGKVFEVEVDGHGKHLVAVEEVQRGHLGTDYVHFSFHKVKANEKTTVTIPVHFIGEAKGTKEGGVVHPIINEVTLKGLPKDIPEHWEIDVTGLEMNHHWTFDDLTPPHGCEWAGNLDTNIVSCHAPKVVSLETPEPQEGELEVPVATTESEEATEDKEAA